MPVKSFSVNKLTRYGYSRKHCVAKCELNSYIFDVHGTYNLTSCLVLIF